MREKLQTLSLVVLREFAKDKKIKGITAMRKAELIDAIIEASGGEEAQAEAPETQNTETQSTQRQEERQTVQSTAAPAARTGRNEETPRYTRNDNAQRSNERPHYEERREYRHYEGRQDYKSDRTEYRNDRQDYRSDMKSDEPDANGILEVLAEGYGFIRCENFLPGENDVYVSPTQIRRFNLKTGDIIKGPKRIRTQNEKFSALLYLESVNGLDPMLATKRPAFEKLTPIFPNERIHLEKNTNTVAMRMVDLISPIGKGQRGMIVSQPKSGKTTLLKQIATAVTKNNPEMHLMILLIDERPEEVTDIRESIEGPNAEVIYSTFDELPEHHKRVSEMVLERAKRLVEHKQDVVILLDSITRLARAYNLLVPPSGRTLSGGLDPAALYMPKKFFGAARNMREGGSLTILATALVETGSKMDDVVFEEFKGTGNMELVLDRKLAEKRIFPAINIQRSGTRREDLLLTKEEQEIVYALHRELSGNRADENMEQILNFFKRTKNNKEFIQLMKQSLLKK